MIDTDKFYTDSEAAKLELLGYQFIEVTTLGSSQRQHVCIGFETPKHTLGDEEYRDIRSYA